ncbi:hypothetical protein KY363_03830 [Candidatus Woesearchaeota archaeon]|nr:hypothetical protein [Candidatus Woesearchaeota archaeon]
MGILRRLFGKDKDELKKLRKQVFKLPDVLDEAEQQRKELAEMENRVYQAKEYIKGWSREFKRREAAINEFNYTSWTGQFVKNMMTPYFKTLNFLKSRAQYAFVQTESGIAYFYDSYAEHEFSRMQSVLAKLKGLRDEKSFNIWKKTVELQMERSIRNLEKIHEDLTEKLLALKNREKHLKRVA